MKKSIYGSAERAEKRNNTSSIHKKTDELIHRFFPDFYNNSIVEIDNNAYISQLNLLFEQMRQDFTAIKDLLQARKYFSEIINEGNISGRWSLDVPLYPMRLKREEPLRTENWFLASKNLNIWAYKWKKHLESKSAADFTNDADQLTAILVSATLYGGLCIPEALVELANQLLSTKTSLISDGNKYWFDLIFDGSSQNHNIIVHDETTKTLHRWFCDPITIARIQKYLRLRNTNVSIPLTKQTLWEDIRNFFIQIDVESSQSIKSLNSFCRSAIGVTENIDGIHINESLVEFAVGKIPCSSLPTTFHEFVIQQPNLQPIIGSDLDNYRAKSIINRRSRKKYYPKMLEGYENVIIEIRTAISPDLKQYKNTPKNALVNLTEILQKPLSEPLVVVVSWLISLLEEDGNAVSSVSRYFSAIGKGWILHTMDCDLQNMDADDFDDFDDLYNHILDADISEKARAYNAARLDQLHTYAHRNFGLEYMEPLHNKYGHKNVFIRAGYITEQAFRVFCSSIDASKFSDPLTKQGLIVLYTLAFRLGLRRGELLKLRIKDISFCAERWLYIRNNRYGNNKSASAYRKIISTPLMLSNEKSDFEEYFKRKRLLVGNKPNALLFSLSQTPYIPLNGNWVSAIAKDFLGEITGLPIIFHQFRHTALSRLQVVLEDDEILIGDLTLYSPSEVKEIQSQLGGFDKSQNRADIYWAMAGIAGHLTPGTTFAHYLHFTDRILANKLARSKIQLTGSAIQELSGLTSHTITRQFNDHYSKNNKVKTLEIQYFQKQISKNIKPFCKQIKKIRVVTDKQKKQGTALKKLSPTIEVCHALLKSVENNATLFELAPRFQVDETLINLWISNARKIASLSTSKRKSRLNSSDRVMTKIGEHLAPSLPQSNIELQDANKAVNKIRNLYKEFGEKLQWCIDYYLNNSNTSLSGLSFKNPKDLKSFLIVMLEVFPATRWRLIMHPLDSVSQDKQINVWEKSCLKCAIQISNKKVKRKSTYPNGLLKLNLRHPDEQGIITKTNKNYQKYSTNSMRYIFHMIAIMTYK